MNPAYLLALIIALVFAGAIYAATRADRNNNPGNIKRTAENTWQGQVACEKIDQAKEKVFACFKDKEAGYRALILLLYNYSRIYNLHTISGILNRYAPASENDTIRYIDFVSRYMLTHPNVWLIMDSTDVADLAFAISWYESGERPPPGTFRKLLEISEGVAAEFER